MARPREAQPTPEEGAVEELSPEEQDSQFYNGFKGVRGGGDQTPPAPTSPAPQEGDSSGDGTESTAQPPPSAPPKSQPEITQVPTKVLQQAAAHIQSIQQENARLKAELAELEKAKQSGNGSAAPPSALREKYGEEFVKKLEEHIEPHIERHIQAMLQAFIPYMVNHVMEEVILSHHPDAEAVRHSREFNEHIAAHPEERENLSGRGHHVVGVLNRFKGRGKEQEGKKGEKGDKHPRLEKTVHPHSAAHPHASAALSDDEAFSVGFRAVRGHNGHKQ